MQSIKTRAKKGRDETVVILKIIKMVRVVKECDHGTEKQEVHEGRRE